MLAQLSPSLLRIVSAAALVTTCVAGLRAQRPVDGDGPSFAREVRPILADHCFACHGPDAATREADLRLDLRESATAIREGDYAAIVPGDPAASELIQRVRDADDPMPPADHPPLADDEISILERWIAAGATYDRHWAYSPPAAHAAPETSTTSEFVRGDIDRFVLHGLEQAGLEPAPRADPRTLVRRLSFDLLGLPPTNEQVLAFAADPSERAWAELVDEFLASPHHAERLATHWFDLVRFADTIGIHGDNPWSVSPYRDWVLGAFRDNMPFDRFTVEQLAGDLLPDATQSQQVAAAYNRLNLITREGGSQPKEFLIRYTADRVRNLGEVWLATSTGCCECHDHKFDPISTREFYELGAFFADIEQQGVYTSGGPASFPPEMQVPSPQQQDERAALNAALAQVNATIDADTAELTADLERFVNELRRADWHPLRPHSMTSTAGGNELDVQPDDSVRAGGPNPGQDTYELEYDLPAGRLAALRLEVLADPSLPQQGPGRAANGNLVLSEIEVRVSGRPVRIGTSRASHEQPNYPVKRAHDGKGGRAGWALLKGSRSQPAEAVFDLAESITVTPGTRLQVRLRQEHGGHHTLGRFRLSASSSTDQPALAPDLRAALGGYRNAGSSPHDGTLRTLHRERTPLLASARAERARVRRALSDLQASIPRVLQTRSVEPMETRVRPRGNWMDDSGDVVLPGVPAAFDLPLTAANDARATRLDLAKWLVDPRHPLTARVVVNRMWRLLFGRGLVQSLDDFGVQGTPPTDLALLDHLATRFVESGWDLRALLRTLATSNAYRQASWGAGFDATDPARRDRFGCQSRFRLDAEFVRDSALAASGLLTNGFGGASVFPYQPAGYWAHLNFPKRRYKASEGADLYRRAVYGHWQRQYVHPSLMAFDAPSRERCTAERARSNTPLAALAALNDPIFVEAARGLAERVLRTEPASDDQRITAMWRHALQREPTPTEAEQLRQLVAAHRDHFDKAPEAAKQLLSVGASPRDERLPLAEHAAWTSAARVVLNLHEMITRD